MCDRYFKAKSKYKQFKSNFHKDFDKCKHNILSLKDIDIKDVDEAFYLYIIEHIEKFDYYLVKCEFKIIFNVYQYCPYITSKTSDNEKMISCSNLLENVIDDFQDEGYNFNHTAEMDIKSIANKMDMSYDFYIKHNMHAVEWNLTADI